MIPTKVSALFFDAVGTLIHPDPPALVVYAAVGRRFGSRLAAEVITARFWPAFGREEDFDRRHGWRTSEARELERWRRIVTTVLDGVADSEACFQELFMHFSRPASWRCQADAAAILMELNRRGYPLGMASNYDSRLRSVVAGLPALRPVQHLVISAEAGWRKPAGAFFDAMCRSAGLPGERILHVGNDRANDYEGALGAGLQAVLFDPEGRDQAPAVTRVTRLHDLLA